MTDLNDIIQDNQKELERLKNLTVRLSEKDFAKTLPNGWTPGVALAHLAFWDQRAAMLLRNWLEKGTEPASIPVDPEVINNPLAVLSRAIAPQAAVKLALEAAEQVDGLVKGLTPQKAGEFLKVGSERFLHRALHRRGHLDKIEKVLGS